MNHHRLLIGTHHSACNQLNWDVSFWDSGDTWETIRRIGKWVYPVRSFIESITCTQTKTISEQLYMNVDVLDLRLSYAKRIFYTSHTFCCSPLEDVLMEIYICLNTVQRKKPLHLFFTPDFENAHTLRNEEREKELLTMITNWLDRFMITQKIIVYYQPLELDLNKYNREQNSDQNIHIYHYRDIQNIWYNVDTVEEYTKKLNDTLFMGYTCLNAVLTPRKPTRLKEYFRYLFKVSLSKFANVVNPLTLNTLKSRTNRPSICLFDFIHSEFVFEIRKLD